MDTPTGRSNSFDAGNPIAFTDPLSGVTLTPQNTQIGMLFAEAGLMAAMAALGQFAGQPSRPFVSLVSFMAFQAFRQNLSQILSTLPPVHIPWADILEVFEEGARLQDNVFPTGLPPAKPLFDYTSPVSSLPGRIFASLNTMTDAQLTQLTDEEHEAIAPAQFSAYGPIALTSAGFSFSGSVISFGGRNYSAYATALNNGQLTPAFEASGQSGVPGVSITVDGPGPALGGGVESP